MLPKLKLSVTHVGDLAAGWYLICKTIFFPNKHGGMIGTSESQGLIAGTWKLSGIGRAPKVGHTGREKSRARPNSIFFSSLYPTWDPVH